ncbi:MAG: hypothetical protein ACYTEI_05260, partial [Planctomycetota bacterium]
MTEMATTDSTRSPTEAAMQIASSEIAKAKGSGHRLLVPEQSAAAVGARPVADVAATQLRGDSLAYA